MDASHFLLALAAGLLTYLLHSTLLLGGVWLWLHCFRVMRPDVRVRLWRGALLGGVLTTVAQTALPLPSWGVALVFVASEESPPSGLHAPPSPIVPVETVAVREPLPSDTPCQVVAATSAAPEIAPLPGVHRAHLQAGLKVMMQVFAGLWLAGCGLTVGRLVREGVRLRQLRQSSRRLVTGRLCQRAHDLARQMNAGRAIELFITTQLDGPIAAGIGRRQVFLPEAFLIRLDEGQLDGLLAHELAHLARRDPLWMFLAHLLARGFFFQPLNGHACRELRREAEFLADDDAAEALADGLGLARCLVALDEWRRPAHQPRSIAVTAAVGMATYRSLLGRRVQRLLDAPPPAGPHWFPQVASVVLLVLILPLLLAGPHAQTEFRDLHQPTLQGEMTMRPTYAVLALALTGPLTASADEKKPTPAQSAAADPVKVKKNQPAQGTGTRATIVAIDAARGTLSVGWNEGGKKSTVELSLAKDVTIALADQKSKTPRPGRLADLAPGTEVVLELSPDKKLVKGIEALGSKLSGAIKTVDQAQRRLTVTRKDENGPGEQTLAIGENAKVSFADGKSKQDVQEGRLADLTVGTPVTLGLSADRTTVLAIAIGGLNIRGSLNQVDLAKRSITVAPKGSPEQTFAVAEDAVVMTSDEKGAPAAKLSDLSVGMSVTIQTSARAPKTVTAIRVSKPTESKKPGK